MAQRNEHLVVVMVEEPPKNEFIIWPLHITIVPWFHSDDDKKLDNVLADVASKHEPFVVSVGEQEHFGRDKKLAVNLINGSKKLHSLHADVFEQLEENEFRIHQKDFLAEKFKPHITHQGKNRPVEGSELLVGSFTLIKQLRQKKTGTMIKIAAKEYFLQ